MKEEETMYTILPLGHQKCTAFLDYLVIKDGNYQVLGALEEIELFQVVKQALDDQPEEEKKKVLEQFKNSKPKLKNLNWKDLHR